MDYIKKAFNESGIPLSAISEEDMSYIIHGSPTETQYFYLENY